LSAFAERETVPNSLLICLSFNFGLLPFLKKATNPGIPVGRHPCSGTYPIEPHPTTVSVCGCGLSRDPPQCDGTHKRARNELPGNVFYYSNIDDCLNMTENQEILKSVIAGMRHGCCDQESLQNSGQTPIGLKVDEPVTLMGTSAQAGYTLSRLVVNSPNFRLVREIRKSGHPNRGTPKPGTQHFVDSSTL
jgi:hypothetical protein